MEKDLMAEEEFTSRFTAALERSERILVEQFDKIRTLETEVRRLTAEKTEMADAILQTVASEFHFRTLVSFEIAEFIFTERLAAVSLESKP